MSKALGLRNNGNHSNYGTFEAKNGTVVRIRISDHNSAVSNFDDAGYENGISIVVTRKPNEGINNNGTAHIVEYYYNGYKLAKAEGHPLAEIARSMQSAIRTSLSLTALSGLKSPYIWRKEFRCRT